MADVEILPDWAARYVQEQLSHLHVINVLPIDKGALSGAFLLNTSKGAVLLQKGRLSEIDQWFMPLPGEHVSFSCDRCQERMDLVDPEVPRIIYCSACGQRHYLVIQDGELMVVKGEQKEGTGFVQDGYTLYRKKAGKDEHYFFAKSKPKQGRPADLPEGAVVELNPRSGVPVVVMPDGTCTAQLASGKRCGAKAKDGVHCGRHQ